MKPRKIIGWLIVLALAVFIVFNLERVEVWFFGIRAELPIGAVILISAVLGAGALYTLLYLKRRSNRM